MTMAAFITNKNKPRVTIVTGNVRIIKRGLINTFKIPNSKAKSMAALKLLTCIPESK